MWPFKSDHLKIKEGDIVSSKLGDFKFKKVLKVRNSHGYSEGNAITVDDSGTEYWSKYLIKIC